MGEYLDLFVECRYMNFIISVINIIYVIGNIFSILIYYWEIVGYIEVKGLCKLFDIKIGIKFIIFMFFILFRKDLIIVCEFYEGNGV